MATLSDPSLTTEHLKSIVLLKTSGLRSKSEFGTPPFLKASLPIHWLRIDVLFGLRAPDKAVSGRSPGRPLTPGDHAARGQALRRDAGPRRPLAVQLEPEAAGPQGKLKDTGRT